MFKCMMLFTFETNHTLRTFLKRENKNGMNIKGGVSVVCLIELTIEVEHFTLLESFHMPDQQIVTGMKIPQYIYFFS